VARPATYTLGVGREGGILGYASNCSPLSYISFLRMHGARSLLFHRYLLCGISLSGAHGDAVG